MRKYILIIEKWKLIQDDTNTDYLIQDDTNTDYLIQDDTNTDYLIQDDTNTDYPNRKKFIRVRERSGSKSTTTPFTQRWLHMKQINCHN
jgi:hypothetical protein